jgi:hypothetical protein
LLAGLNGVPPTRARCICVNAQYFSRNLLGSRTWKDKVGGVPYHFEACLVDPPRAGLVSGAFSSCTRPVLTEICRCNAWSGQ